MTKNTQTRKRNRLFMKLFGKEMARFLTLVLCLSLLCVYVPLNAWAEEEEGDEYIYPKRKILPKLSQHRRREQYPL